MKKSFHYWALCLGLCVIVGTIFVACTKCESPIVEKNSLIQSVSKDSKWLREVNYSLNLTTRVSSDEQVVLKDYKYLGVVDSESTKEELIKDIFYENAHTISNSSDLKTFMFFTWEELRKMYNVNTENLVNQVSNVIEIGKTEVLELTWLYSGVTYKSKAVVDKDKGILFDNIASFAIDYSAKNRVTDTTRTERVETRASIDSLDSTAYRIRTFSVSDKAYGINLVSGKIAWEYKISVKSAFDQNGILVDRDIAAQSYAELGWECFADARTISGDLYSSTFHEFAWVWAYGNNNTTINISFAGNGFSVTGGQARNSGVEIHRK